MNKTFKQWLSEQDFTSNFHKKDEFFEGTGTALSVTELNPNAVGQGNGAIAVAGINVLRTVGQLESSVNLSNDTPIGFPIVIMNVPTTQATFWPPVGGSINGVVDGQFGLSGSEKMVTAYRIGENEFFIQGANEI